MSWLAEAWSLLVEWSLSALPSVEWSDAEEVVLLAASLSPKAMPMFPLPQMEKVPASRSRAVSERAETVSPSPQYWQLVPAFAPGAAESRLQSEQRSQSRPELELPIPLLTWMSTLRGRHSLRPQLAPVSRKLLKAHRQAEVLQISFSRVFSRPPVDL